MNGAMPEPNQTSPLAPYRARFAALAGEDVTIREGRPLAQINLRGDPDDPVFDDAVSSVVCCSVPRLANTVSRQSAGPRSIMWLGPDEWLIIAAEGEGPTLCADLMTALTGRHISVIDVSANRIIVELSGLGARDIIAKGCTLDLHPRTFTTGQCAQTLLAHVPIILEQTEATPTYKVYVRPSVSRYLADWFLNAALR